jgi:hypothetical protein
MTFAIVVSIGKNSSHGVSKLLARAEEQLAVAAD